MKKDVKHEEKLSEHNLAIANLKANITTLRQEIATKIFQLQQSLDDKDKELEELIKTKANQSEVDNEFQRVNIDINGKFTNLQDEINATTNGLRILRKEVNTEVTKLKQFDQTLQIQVNEIDEFAKASNVSIGILNEKFDAKLKNLSDTLARKQEKDVEKLTQDIATHFQNLKDGELKKLGEQDNTLPNSVTSIETILNDTKSILQQKVTDIYEDLPELLRANFNALITRIDKKEDKEIVNSKVQEIAVSINATVTEFISKDFADLKQELGDMRDTTLKKIDTELNRLKGEDTKVNKAIDDIKNILKDAVEKLGENDASFDKLPTTIKSKLTEIQTNLLQKASSTALEEQKVSLQQLIETEKTNILEAQKLTIATVTSNLAQQMYELVSAGVKQADVDQINKKLKDIQDAQLKAIGDKLYNVLDQTNELVAKLSALEQSVKELKDAGITLDEATSKVISDLTSDLYDILSSVGKADLSNLSMHLKDFASIKATLVNDLSISPDKFDHIQTALNDIVKTNSNLKLSHQQKIQIENFMTELVSKVETRFDDNTHEVIIKQEGFFKADSLLETVQALNEIIIKSAYQHANKTALNTELDILSEMIPKTLTVGNAINEINYVSHDGNYVVIEQPRSTPYLKKDEHIKVFYNKYIGFSNQDILFTDFIKAIQTELNNNQFNELIQKQIFLNANVENRLYNVENVQTNNSQHWVEAREKIHLASVIYEEMKDGQKDLAKSDVQKLMPDFEGYDLPLVNESTSDETHQ